MEKKLYKVIAVRPSKLTWHDTSASRAFAHMRNTYGFSQLVMEGKIYIDFICGVGRTIWLLIYELPEEDYLETELDTWLDAESIYEYEKEFTKMVKVYSDYSAYSLYKRIENTVMSTVY